MVRGEEWEPTLDDPIIQDYIFEAAGEEGLPMARFIAEKEPISGEDLLEAHEERKPSDVRKVLYALMEARVAEYQKDTDAKGWETFIWKMTLYEVKYLLRRHWEEELEELKQALRYEQDHEFYACPHLHRRVIFEDAMDLQFQCPVCEEPLNPVDNQEIKEALEARIGELEADGA
ncbi:MAG: hypothetical protein ACPGQL_01495 [Thermoplasmatota archaeon]